MTFILLVGMAFLGYKLYQSNKQKQIAFNHYMQDRVVRQGQPSYLIGPNGQQHPTWCPNCGKNL